MTYAVPIEANHRLADLLSEQASNESIASTARWFAELMIDKFLSDSAKDRLTPDKFSRLSLGEAIAEIKNDFAPALIDALYLLKSLGDKASHYKKGKSLSASEAKSAVQKALSLFDLILIDELLKKPLDATENRATIFSTLMPSVRAHVLQELLREKPLNAIYRAFLVHKYILARTKNGEKQKAKKFIINQLSNNLVSQKTHDFELATIEAIDSGLQSGKLPVAQTLGDAKRNLDKVLETLSENEKLENARLISIADRLLEEVRPSEMGNLIGHATFIV